MITVWSNCVSVNDQGLAESLPRTCDRRGDPRRASAGASELLSAAFHFYIGGCPPAFSSVSYSDKARSA